MPFSNFQPRPRCPNVFGRPEQELIWILGRAEEFDVVDGVSVPRYSYKKIARIFSARIRLNVSRYVVRDVVVRFHPLLARRRGDAYPLARLVRKSQTAESG